jgi:hypothetical protein
MAKRSNSAVSKRTTSLELDLERALLEHFIGVFLPAARLSQSHRSEALDQMSLQVDLKSEDHLFLRLVFPWVGPSHEVEWDGTPDFAFEIMHRRIPRR